MNRVRRTAPAFASLAALAASIVAVGATADAASDPLTAALTRSVTTFAERVVLPAHEALATSSTRLVTAAAAFERAPDEATLEAFRRERLRVAVFRASGRAFAFGPIHSLGHDAALDSPVDETGVELTIESLAGASVADIERERLVSSLTGLGTIAYLLDAQDDPAAFAPATRRYLHALARRIDGAANDLLDVWRNGHDGHPAFASVLATAGQPDNRPYPSVESAAEEIVRGLIDTLDVVVHEELPGVVAGIESLTSPTGVTSLALLDASVDGVERLWSGAEIGRWLETGDDDATAAAVRRSLDDASRALASAIAGARDAGGARSALERAADELERARTSLESRALPLTRLENRPVP